MVRDPLGIDTPHGSGAVEGTVASVDAQVSSRITATRLVTLGVFALSAKKNTGAIYLSIDNPALASVVECPKDAQMKARQFAVQITNAGKNAAALEARRPAEIAGAEQALAVVRADTGAVDAARTELKRIEADQALLLPATAAREALKAAEVRLSALTGKPGAAALPE
jgi:hypothetical protein